MCFAYKKMIKYKLISTSLENVYRSGRSLNLLDSRDHAIRLATGQKVAQEGNMIKDELIQSGRNTY